MAEVVQLQADTSDKDAILGILDDMRAKTEAGQVLDIAIATVERDGDGEPMLYVKYHGCAQFGSLLGAVALLKHNMLVGIEPI